MSARISDPGQEIIAGQQSTNNYLNTQKILREFNPQAQNKIKELNELEAGQTGLVISIRAKTPEILQMLTAMRISPYAAVKMIDKHPRHIIFKIDHRKFGADREIGAMIFIQPI